MGEANRVPRVSTLQLLCSSRDTPEPLGCPLSCRVTAQETSTKATLRYGLALNKTHLLKKNYDTSDAVSSTEMFPCSDTRVTVGRRVSHKDCQAADSLGGDVVQLR
jgi:hypothetical protein